MRRSGAPSTHPRKSRGHAGVLRVLLLLRQSTTGTVSIVLHMDIDQKRVDELLAHPSESLNVEIKNWIRPGDKAGEAKIVRATLALRNRNGGYLIIGFHDKTLRPELKDRPSDVRELFHVDKVQGLISNYASVAFEVGVAFGQRDGQDYPVIVIPEGVRSPVAAKSDLIDGSGKPLIRYGDVYFRTLAANGTPSTAPARPQDWPERLSKFASRTVRPTSSARSSRGTCR